MHIWRMSEYMYEWMKDAEIDWWYPIDPDQLLEHR